MAFGVACTPFCLYMIVLDAIARTSLSDYTNLDDYTPG